MQNEGKVKQKIKDAKFRYMKRELRDKLKVCPRNCVHNERHTFTTYEYGEDGEPTVAVENEIGLCMYGADNPEEWPGKICDDVKTAQECPLFQGKYDKEDVKEAFHEKLEDDVYVAENFKDIAALQWVVGEQASEMPMALPQRAWFSFLYLWFLVAQSVKRTGIF